MAPFKLARACPGDGIGLDAKDFTKATIKPRPALGRIVQLG